MSDSDRVECQFSLKLSKGPSQESQMEGSFRCARNIWWPNEVVKFLKILKTIESRPFE